jgi:hypothetical protein
MISVVVMGDKEDEETYGEGLEEKEVQEETEVLMVAMVDMEERVAMEERYLAEEVEEDAVVGVLLEEGVEVEGAGVAVF